MRQNHFCVGFRIQSRSLWLDNSQIICQTQTTRLCTSGLHLEIAQSGGKSGVARNEGEPGRAKYHILICLVELQGGGRNYIKEKIPSPPANGGPACLYLGFCPKCPRYELSNLPHVNPVSERFILREWILKISSRAYNSKQRNTRRI